MLSRYRYIVCIFSVQYNSIYIKNNEKIGNNKEPWNVEPLRKKVNSFDTIFKYDTTEQLNDNVLW